MTRLPYLLATRRFAGTVAGLVLLAALAACSEARQWQTSTLDKGFPELSLELTTHDGATLTEGKLRGGITLLFFGYTSCPDACPATMTTLRAALGELPADQQAQVTVVFVSVDPERDTPQRLAAYASYFGPRFTGATADIPRLRQLASRYGTTFDYGPGYGGDYYVVSHGSNVLAFDRDGRARLLIRPHDSIEAIVHDLRRLLS